MLDPPPQRPRVGHGRRRGVDSVLTLLRQIEESDALPHIVRTERLKALLNEQMKLLTVRLAQEQGISIPPGSTPKPPPPKNHSCLTLATSPPFLRQGPKHRSPHTQGP